MEGARLGQQEWWFGWGWVGELFFCLEDAAAPGMAQSSGTVTPSLGLHTTE